VHEHLAVRTTYSIIYKSGHQKVFIGTLHSCNKSQKRLVQCQLTTLGNKENKLFISHFFSHTLGFS